jgi:hypothetical protein
MMIQDDDESSSSNSSINEKSILLDSSKRYLSKSTSQLCDQSSIDIKEEQVSPSSRNILDVIQEELVNNNNNKSLFLSFLIYLD